MRIRWFYLVAGIAVMTGTGTALACSGCSAEAALIAIPFYPAWLVLFAVWMVVSLIITVRYRTYRFWAHPYISRLFFVFAAIGVLIDVVQSFPLFTLILCVIVWIGRCVTCLNRRRIGKTLPGDRALRWLNLCMLVLLALSAVWYVVRLNREGIVYKLSVINLENGTAISKSLQREVHRDSVDMTSVVALLEKGSATPVSNACYILGEKREQGDGSNATDFIIGHLALKAKGAMPEPFATALQTLTQQRFTNTADVLKWWVLRDDTNDTSNTLKFIEQQYRAADTNAAGICSLPKRTNKITTVVYSLDPFRTFTISGSDVKGIELEGLKDALIKYQRTHTGAVYEVLAEVKSVPEGTQAIMDAFSSAKVELVHYWAPVSVIDPKTKPGKYGIGHVDILNSERK